MANSYILNGERVSVDAYNKEKYEDLRVRVKKGSKDKIKAHADFMGESVNAFIGRSIAEAMERDRASRGVTLDAESGEQ